MLYGLYIFVLMTNNIFPGPGARTLITWISWNRHGNCRCESWTGFTHCTTTWTWFCQLAIQYQVGFGLLSFCTIESIVYMIMITNSLNMFITCHALSTKYQFTSSIRGLFYNAHHSSWSECFQLVVMHYKTRCQFAIIVYWRSQQAWSPDYSPVILCKIVRHCILSLIFSVFFFSFVLVAIGSM